MGTEQSLESVRRDAFFLSQIDLIRFESIYGDSYSDFGWSHYSFVLYRVLLLRRWFLLVITRIASTKANFDSILQIFLVSWQKCQMDNWVQKHEVLAIQLRKILPILIRIGNLKFYELLDSKIRFRIGNSQ